MARQSSARTELEDMTECSICTEVFTDPRVLPCVHTFCLKCLLNYGKDSQPGDTIPCPLCRKEFAIPDDGLEATQKNFFMEKLLKLKKLSAGLNATHVLCDVCSYGIKGTLTSNVIASMHCIQCQQNYCQLCSLSHARMKLSADHVQTEIEKEMPKNEVPTPPSVRCEAHRDKEIEVFCLQCKVAICRICFTDSHKHHFCSDIDEVSIDLRKQVKGDAEKATNRLKKTKELLIRIEGNRREFIGHIVDVESKINKTADDMIDTIQRDRRKLLSEIESIRIKRAKQLETMKEEVEQYMVALEGFKRYSETLLSSGTACDVARATKNLHYRANELVMLNVIGDVDSALSPLCIKFLQSDLLTSSISNLVGNINQDTKPRPPTVTHVLHRRNSVCGIASLENNVYVLCESSQQIEVYDAQTFVLQQRLAVPGLGTNQCSTAVCAVNRCLYIPDFHNNSLHRVELSGNNAVTNWSVARGPKGVSVNNAKNVLVVSNGDNRLQEFTTRGILIRNIQLNSDVQGPSHAVQLGDNRFLVSHDGSLHRVSLVAGDGRVRRSYGGDAKMDSPRGLAVDRHDNVLIADWWNNRLLVLDQSLNSAHEMSVSVDGGLQGPYSLHYDSSRRRVYIGEYDYKNLNGHRVIVIDNVDDFSASRFK